MGKRAHTSGSQNFFHKWILRIKISHGPMGMLKGLNLTSEQQTKVDSIMEQHKGEVQSMDDKVAASRQALHEAIHSDVFEEQKIREASKVSGCRQRRNECSEG
jgi:Spy/CpxP family protein refolding chaperone